MIFIIPTLIVLFVCLMVFFSYLLDNATEPVFGWRTYIGLWIVSFALCYFFDVGGKLKEANDLYEKKLKEERVGRDKAN